MDIVIYEQDELTQALLRDWLARAGYRVRSGELGGASPLPRADLAIVGLYMPKHAGACRVRSIRAMHPQTPIIAISGQFRSGLRAGGAVALELGVQQVIAKPLARADLIEAVRGIIGVPNQ